MVSSEMLKIVVRLPKAFFAAAGSLSLSARWFHLTLRAYVTPSTPSTALQGPETLPIR